MHGGLSLVPCRLLVGSLVSVSPCGLGLIDFCGFSCGVLDPLAPIILPPPLAWDSPSSASEVTQTQKDQQGLYSLISGY